MTGRPRAAGPRVATVPPAPQHGADDAALSSVLGAILIVGLLVVTLVTVQVQFVPRWDEDRESRHMAQVSDQIGVFKSDIERLVTNATMGGVTDPLTLRSDAGFRFFSSGSMAHTQARFAPSPSGTGVVLSSPSLRIQVRDGEGLFGLDENWIAIPASGLVEDITDVNHLRVRIDQVPGDYVEGDNSTLAIYDADGDFAGRAVVTFRDFPSEQALEVTIYNANGQLISSSLEAFFQQTQVDFYYVDMLDPELLFRDVLAATETPYTLQLQSAGLDSSYTVVYQDSAGGSGGSNGGLVVPNYSETLPSGSLSIDTGYQQLPDQNLVLEHGALLVVQGDGAAMVIPPTLGVTVTPQQAILDLVVPGLHGSATSLAGARSASLAARHGGEGTQIEASAARLTLVLPTSYPAVWAAYLQDTFLLAGLLGDAPDPQFIVTPTGNAVQVDLFGPASGPSDTTEDIFIRYQQATIDLTLIPSG